MGPGKMDIRKVKKLIELLEGSPILARLKIRKARVCSALVAILTGATWQPQVMPPSMPQYAPQQAPAAPAANVAPEAESGPRQKLSPREGRHSPWLAPSIWAASAPGAKSFCRSGPTRSARRHGVHRGSHENDELKLKRTATA